jgi:excisionase family DNA binding protein
LAFGEFFVQASQTKSMGKYLRIDELSEYIKLSRSSIYKMTMGNKIPFIKTGKKLLFNQEAIDQWLEQFAQPTVQELKNNSVNILKSTTNGRN